MEIRKVRTYKRETEKDKGSVYARKVKEGLNWAC